MDLETFITDKKSLRGGIPLLFPNPGELNPDTQFPQLKRHGLVRNMQRQKNKTAPNTSTSTLSMSCRANEHTKQSFPFDRSLDQSITSDNNAQVTLTHTIHNTGTSTMPFHFGLQPYFPVAHKDKKNIAFNFSEGETIQAQYNIRAQQSGTLYIPTPSTPFTITIPGIGTLERSVHPAYKRLRIRSEPDRDFICIEPSTAKPGELDTAPLLLEPGASTSLTRSMKIL